MKNFEILADALEEIESNLCGALSQEQIAARCYVSLSHLQKLFRYALRVSIGEYVTKRRLTQAARDLVRTDGTVTEIAMKYGYNSPEVFTRAFVKLWQTTPSKFRRTWQFTNIYPKINVHQMNPEDDYMGKRKFDAGELYDYLRGHAGCWILSFDTVNLMRINQTYGRQAGDAVITECLRRIDSEAGDEMLLLRIGGDEFVLMTGTEDLAPVQGIADRIRAQNGRPILFDNTPIPVSMRIGMTRIPQKHLRYSELFAALTEAPRGDNEITERERPPISADNSL